VAAAAAMLFAVHPIHTETITFMMASFNQISAFFFLMAVYFHANGFRYSKIAALVSSFFAIFSSETAITLPVVIILYDLCFKEKLKLKKYAPYFAVAFFYLFIRFFMLGIGARTEAYPGGSFYLTFLTMGKVFLKYIALLILPVNLTPFQYVKPASSIFESGVLLPWAGLLVLLIYSPKIYRSSRLAFFCIAWFFITLFPVSNIIPIQIFIAERYLYLPSVGFCLLFALAIEEAHLRLPARKKIAPLVFFVLAITSYSAMTIDRNLDWRDEVTLWTRTVEASPNSINAHKNLDRALNHSYYRHQVDKGLIYFNEGKYQEALNEFEVAAIFRPNDPIVYIYLGNVYTAVGMFDLAELEYRVAIELDPENPGYINNLANTFHARGMYDEAITLYKQALEFAPENKEFHKNLANSYYGAGEFVLSIEEFEKVLLLDNSDTEALIRISDAHNELGIVYGKAGQYDLAIEEFNKAVSLNPGSAESHANLGNAYALTEEYGLAREEFEKAVELDPNNEIYREALERL
jgi:Flp pilus assembly protein TadD